MNVSRNSMENIPLNKFEELKRNRFIKKMRSNAIAIKTNQIEIHSGCMKMEFYMNRINEIEYLNEIDLEIFEDFNNETRFYPIEEEREKYNIEYLKKLDVELNKIDEKYRDRIYEKCDEIITKFEYILEILKK